MAFTPNYKKMGIESIEQAWVHILGFIKKSEDAILKRGLSKNPSCAFILGDMTITIGDADYKTLEKPTKQKGGK